MLLSIDGSDACARCYELLPGPVCCFRSFPCSAFRLGSLLKIRAFKRNAAFGGGSYRVSPLILLRVACTHFPAPLHDLGALVPRQLSSLEKKYVSSRREP
jgi:hypothetical protein